jgi:hypothetical protein
VIPIMFIQRPGLSFIAFAAVLLTATPAWPLGFQLGETKEQLKLQYEVAATDHGTGRVTINLTIADQGRLKPLDRGVYLVIPNDDGTRFVDLSISLAIREVDGKQVVSVHLLKELAERAEIQLKTSTLDGRQEPLTWYYHTIPIADYLDGDKAKTP